MKNKLKELIEFCGYSYKKEMLLIAIINVTSLLGLVLLYLFLKNLLFVIIAFLGVIFINYFLLTRYKDKKRSILKDRENELVSIISYFEVYIHNKNNVYQSFNNLIPYCSDWMKERIEELLKDIDLDKSVTPFIKFANNFEQLSAHSLMLSIYQMVDQGENSKQLLQFKTIFDELSKNRQKEMMETKEKGLSNMSIFPLIGAGLITVTLTIAILSILGDLINVI